MSKIYLIPGTWSGSVSWTNAALWSTGVVPTTGDDIYMLTGSGLTFDTGINQASVLLNSLTGSVSAPKLGGLGTNCIQIGITTQYHGVGNVDGSGGNGSQRIKINTGTNPTTINLLATASTSGESGVPPAVFLGSNSANALYQTAGVAGVAMTSPADVATFGTIETEGGTLFIGPGTTFNTFVNRGCNATLQAGGGSASVTSLDGTTTTQGTFTVGAATVSGGNLILNHRPTSGTMVADLAIKGGTLDMSGNPANFNVARTSRGDGQLKLFQDGQQNFGVVTLAFNGKATQNASSS